MFINTLFLCYVYRLQTLWECQRPPKHPADSHEVSSGRIGKTISEFPRFWIFLNFYNTSHVSTCCNTLFTNLFDTQPLRAIYLDFLLLLHYLYNLQRITDALLELCYEGSLHE